MIVRRRHLIIPFFCLYLQDKFTFRSIFINPCSAFVIPICGESCTRNNHALFQDDSSSAIFGQRQTNDGRAVSTREKNSIYRNDPTISSRFQTAAISEITTNPDDDIFRNLRQQIPIIFQSWMRDSGFLRWIMDFSIVFGVTGIVEEYPWVLDDFFHLTDLSPNLLSVTQWLTKNNDDLASSRESDTSMSRGLDSDCEFQGSNLPYGSDKRQYVRFFSLKNSLDVRYNTTIVIVHGGAWGSGFPNLYALTAIPFLNSGYAAVAIVGYRTYPTSDVEGQIDDIVSSLQTIQAQRQSYGTVLIAHSSGSHICTMAFLRGRLQNMQIDGFAGLAGVYDIPRHYQFERSRGIERISPMSAACGSSLARWKELSPTRLAMHSKNSRSMFPLNAMLFHGSVDTTVPFQSTVDFANSTGLEWEILKGFGHGELITGLMFDGEIGKRVLQWLEALAI